MKHAYFSILMSAFLLVSCEYFYKHEVEQTAVARVNDVFLYTDDLQHLFTENMSSEDSLLRVNNFITRWATQQLLVAGAELNLNEKKLQDFNRLAKQYKNDLYATSYLDALVRKNIDTVVTESEAETYYTNNPDIFTLKENLIKFRYIHVDENRLDINDLKTKFQRFDADDKRELDSIAIQFKSYSLNDSIWIKVTQAIKKIPVVTTENKNELLKKSNFIQLKDSLGLYLMQIEDVLERNSAAPLEYIKPTIDQIVINKRKLELIKELEKDITKDAIKNKQFEIYN
ncbi:MULTISPECIES: peptidyl-prolyl cis-trans isomerase [unclassified Bizionia]|uniref:peptidyl-prolyl cis-trans isomerase n=1 Tax=unclassified Bizionia TaxID=2626393 RepID=UPI00206A4987|nr:peptidyl-prolyl cis-trans isomerase [Bizionia sp. M204]UPS90576.1 peptidyl-prolyl cis-trans isomerase [Bizionia sp. M204]